MAHPRNVETSQATERKTQGVGIDQLSAIPANREALLMIRIGETKERVIAAWSRAVPVIAPSGHVTVDEAREVGVGVAVYAAMAARYGKTAQEALTHDEFLALLPSLIEYWPVTEEGLVALEDLLAETEAVYAVCAG
ncbi:MAG: hypothetical protein EA385_00355 [Salinarimonadaceae bacterium]|nr:MAG: hypothetical protein EA385_00355 [Salinarimonadaceae bacterium]